jgi:hypothetical protein
MHRSMRRFQPAARIVRGLRELGTVGALTVLGARGALAQPSAVAVHRIGAQIHTTTELLGTRIGVRPLSDGRMLVSDPQNSRLLLFDSTLEHATTVADTTIATGKAWGKGLVGLIPFVGDSSLALDVLTKAYVVIDPAGKIARVIPAPARGLIGGEQTLGEAVGYDRAGHLLYRAPRPVFLSLLDPDFVGDTLMKGPDTIPILRRDLVTGALDTLALVRAQRTRQAVRRRAEGGASGRSAFNPVAAADDWTVLDDGTVAVIKIADYHVDWIRPDRRVTSTGKIPATWVPISSEQKAAMIDTLRVRDSVLAAERAESRPAGGTPSAVIEASDLPDFWPPFATESTVPAPDGTVWVREGRVPASAGAPVYDVISHDGTLIDRVQVPGGATVAAAGRRKAFLVERANGRSSVIEAIIP